MKILKAYVSFWKHYLQFSGSSSRTEYWGAFLCNWIIRAPFLIWGAIGLLFMTHSVNTGLIIGLIYSALALIPSLALTARRYRDAGLSPWWMIGTYLMPYLLYFVAFHLPASGFIMNSIQNGFCYFIFVCLVVAIILPMFPAKQD